MHLKYILVTIRRKKCTNGFNSLKPTMLVLDALEKLLLLLLLLLLELLLLKQRSRGRSRAVGSCGSSESSEGRGQAVVVVVVADSSCVVVRSSKTQRTQI